MNEATTTIIHVRIVFKEKIRITRIIAALNYLQVKSCDILNTHEKAPVTEKGWTTLGPEFGKDARKTAVTV